MDTQRLRLVAIVWICVGVILSTASCRPVGKERKRSVWSYCSGDLVVMKCGKGIVVGKDEVTLDEDYRIFGKIIGDQDAVTLNPDVSGLFICLKDGSVVAPEGLGDKVDVYMLSNLTNRIGEVGSCVSLNENGRRVIVIGDSGVVEVALVEGEWKDL